jgi:hypothetical protein
MSTDTYLHLSPWARDRLTVDEAVAVHARAAALDAHVSAVFSSGGWTVHAIGQALRASVYHAKGRLYTAINAALDDYARQKDILEEEVADLFGLAVALDYTNDELRTIRDQTDA